nr:sensor histidine kinase [uncultured Cellulosilyticum sp.]
MIPEEYFILWGWADVCILSLVKVYVFRVLSQMIGDIKIHKALYNILCIMLFVVVMLIRLSDESILVLFLVGAGAIWIALTCSYGASLVQRWILLVSFVATIIMSETLTQSIIYEIYALEIPKNFIHLRTIYSIGIIFTGIVLIGQMHIYKRLEICIRHDSWSCAGVLIPIMINSTIMVIAFYYANSHGISLEVFAKPLIYMEIGLLLANTAIVFSAVRLAKFYELEMERREAQERSQSEYEYYSHLEAEQERIRLLYHDINNHIACIKEVAKEHEELARYINALEKDVQTTKVTYKTGCSVVDAILRQKSILCNKKQIELEVNLNLTKCDFVEDKDLCSIFANALDNAIEACDRITSGDTKKYIHMESQVIRGFLVVKIRNSKEHMNKWIDNLLVTQKKDKKLHGLGLKNIKRALEKYEGEYIINEEVDEFYLKLVIPMQAPKK